MAAYWFTHFIDASPFQAFKKIAGYIDYANKSSDIKVVAGGTYDDSVGFYIQPTIYETSNPKDKIMEVRFK